MKLEQMWKVIFVMWRNVFFEIVVARVTGDLCYAFKNIFAEEFGEKMAFFC
jgi:hypothetical protein